MSVLWSRVGRGGEVCEHVCVSVGEGRGPELSDSLCAYCIYLPFVFLLCDVAKSFS